ncbi:MAG: DUF898 family protein [Rhodobacteraceae bacterium]|nr:DUF898 family protein [Paracoccaceae bacterium]
MDLSTEFAGRRSGLFWLALRTSILTVLTLGFYRFWMKTRLRRYYWSAIRPGGHPLEYTGRPMEKFLGFLIAVVVLAFYIGVVNLILMFLSFSFFRDNTVAYSTSFLGVLPLIFFAQYRARRYVLARTRWRGIRFGMEAGAWGYAWRAALHWMVTLLTFGLLLPRMTFWLEKYRTDRTFFGTARLNQGGTWTMLRPAMRYLYIGLGMVALTVYLTYANDSPPGGLIAATLALLPAAYVYYRAMSLRLLAEAKTLGDVGLGSAIRPWRVVRIHVFGYLLTGLSLLILVFAAAFTLAFTAGVLRGMGAGFDIEYLARNLPQWALITLGAMLYFSVFVLWEVLGHVFITLPLLRHYAETLTVTRAHALAEVVQRDRDEFAEAEGFADALDVGAAL